MTLTILRSYLQILRYFRNGPGMVRSLRSGPVCDRAVLWDGTELIHPAGRPGLVEAALKIWGAQVYAPPGFYHPLADDVIADIGANVGLFTIWMTRMNPRCRVISLEPCLENFHCLEHNIRAARARTATPYRLAIGGALGHGTIREPGKRSLDHFVVACEDSAAERADSVPIVPLTELFELAKVDSFALLKMDVEGAEYDVFAATDTETLSRFERVALEYHDHLRPGTSELIKEKLQSTHWLNLVPSEVLGCGILTAVRRGSQRTGFSPSAAPV